MTQTIHLLIIVGFLGAVWLGPSTDARASDVRLALLVGHEQGWKKDPRLQYAIKGDLRPLAKTLKRLGFKVLTLENKGPAALRQMLKWLQSRTRQSPQVTTFLFYYSGHSDKRALHLGPKGKTPPITYQELVSAFQTLQIARRYIILDSCFSGEIIRKFGSVSRYKHLVPKGARARRWVNLSQGLPGQKVSDETSLQVMSSGLAVSWESQKYKASIFTYHLLRGLRGRADRDLNGSISIGELFDFVSDAMHKDIQEKPKLFGVVKRSHSYPLAPAYDSQLEIGARIKGQLQVSVANFYWSMHKEQQRPMRLSLVHGPGTVLLRKGGQCYHQQVRLQRHGLTRLKGDWQNVRCKRFARRSKGSISLETQVLPPSTWRLEARLGLLGDTLPRTNDTTSLFFGGELGIRRRFFSVTAGVWGASTKYNQQQTNNLYLNLRGELGYRHRWHIVSLFAGGYAELGLLLQDLNLPNPGVGPLFQYGIALTPTFWFHPRWGLHIHARTGFVLAQLGAQWVHKWTWGATLGLTYHL